MKLKKSKRKKNVARLSKSDPTALLSKKSSNIAPDFNLAPIKEFDSRIFKSSKNDIQKEVKGLMLSLALVFNDYKGIDWIITQLNKYTPETKNEISSYTGQFYGYMNQLSRLSMGMFHSLVELLEKNSTLLKTPQFVKYTDNFSSKAKLLWMELIDIAFLGRNVVEQKYGAPVVFLHKIRSKVAFHYDQNYILSAYNRCFSKEEEHFKYAYVSLGKNLEESRFYFADAAAQEALTYDLENQDLISSALDEFRKMMNEPIKALVESYLLQEQEHYRNEEFY